MIVSPQLALVGASTNRSISQTVVFSTTAASSITITISEKSRSCANKNGPTGSGYVFEISIERDPAALTRKETLIIILWSVMLTSKGSVPSPHK